MLDALTRKRPGIDFQVVRGVSVGAINGSVLAMAAPVTFEVSSRNLREQVSQLLAFWDGISSGADVHRRRFLGKIGAAVAGFNSAFGLEPLWKKLGATLNEERVRKGRDFAFGTVSLVHGCYQEWSNKSGEAMDNWHDFLLRLRASAASPFFYPPSYFQGRGDILVDGGVRNILPVTSLAACGEFDEIYVLLTSRVLSESGGTVMPGAWAEYRDASAAQIASRCLEILMDQVLVSDLRQVVDTERRRELAHRGGLTAERKDLLERATGWKNLEKKRKIYVIAPIAAYGVDGNNDGMDFRRDSIQGGIQTGRLSVDRIDFDHYSPPTIPSGRCESIR